MCVYIYIYVHICMYVYIYIYIYIYIYVIKCIFMYFFVCFILKHQLSTDILHVLHENGTCISNAVS